jgi:predicted DNA-binding protein YlxM (UPF0122 family)
MPQPLVEKSQKLTDLVRQQIEEAAAMDCTIEEIALYANVSRQALYNWFNSFPELKERVDTLRNDPFLKARSTIIKALSNPDHAFRYMERKKKFEFGPNVDVTTMGEKLNAYTDEQIAAIANRVIRAGGNESEEKPD